MQTNTICEYFLKLHNKNVNKNKKVIKKIHNKLVIETKIKIY